MKILVDADACPVVIRDILLRAAERTETKMIFVANQFVNIQFSENVSLMQVESGFDMADKEIVKQAEVGDLVITSDIPLASEAIDKGALALSPRGELLNKANVKARLNIRDFMDTMRSSGIQTGGPPPLNQRDKQQFANHLDKWLHSKSHLRKK